MESRGTVNAALFILRLALGLFMLYYGSQKMLGAFGGAGFTGTLEGMQQGLGIPPAFAALAIFAEFFGSLGVLVGLLTRIAAFGIACTMAVATFLKIQATTTLVQVPGQPAPLQEIAYPATFLAIALALMLTGPGSLSLDARLFGRKRR